MSDINPTIIAASLSDKELKKSIDSLVQFVEEGTKKMSQSMTTAVEEMKRQLQSLGEIKVNTGGASDGGSTRRRKTQNEETQAVKETVAAYDELAKATQKPNSARESYITFMKGYGLNELISQEESRILEQQIQRVKDYENEIKRLENAKKEVQQTKMSDRNEKLAQYDQIINAIRTKIKEINADPMKGVDTKRLEELKAMRQNIASLISGETQMQEAQTAATQKQTDAIREQEQAQKQMFSSYDEWTKGRESGAERSKRASAIIASLPQGGKVDIYPGLDREFLKQNAAIKQNATEYTNLEHIVSQYLGIKLQESTLAQNLGGAYTVLSDTLKKLHAAYREMSETDRNSKIGKELIQRIQEVEHAMQKIQMQASRPVDWESVWKLPTKTLDDIAYKIQMLRLYRSGLDTNNKDEINKTTQAIEQLEKEQRKLIGSNKSLLESNNVLARSWNYMKNRLAFYLTVSAATSFVKSLIEVRSQYEMLTRSIGILVDDVRKGGEIFNQLNAMAMKSPFTTMELGAAAKQLVAFNIAADDVVDTTKRLADMAAAVGIPIERLTYALGQVRAYGYLNSRDARIFLNAGIPIIQMLTDMYNKQRDVNEQMVTASQVREMMTKRLISYADVMKVVNEATDEGGRFFNYQEKLAGTLKVQLANLTLAYNNMMNEIGKDNQGVISKVIETIKSLYKNWRDVLRILGTVIVTFGAYKTAVAAATLWNKLFTTTVDGAARSVTSFSMVMKNVGVAGWVGIIASLLSYFVFFNDTLGDTGRKLKELNESFRELERQFADMYTKAVLAKTLNEQIEELRNIINKAQSELSITIPINIEEVNEENVRQKIEEARMVVEDYASFAEQFSKTAIEADMSEKLSIYGSSAENLLQLITQNQGLLKQALIDAGIETKLLDELSQRENESNLEYLTRYIGILEKMGILSNAITNGGDRSLAKFIANAGEAQKTAERALERWGIKNKDVFLGISKDFNLYNLNLINARDAFDDFSKDLAKRIDVFSFDEDKRKQKVEVAIDKYAVDNQLNEFSVQLLKFFANQKYKIDIPLNIINAKKESENLKQWQKNLQKYADEHGIKIPISFTEEQSEESFVDALGKRIKDERTRLGIFTRGLTFGTYTKEDVDRATKNINVWNQLFKAAGGTEKETGGNKDVLGDALSKQLQLINEIQKSYKEYRKLGIEDDKARKEVSDNYTKSLETQSKILEKFGVKGVSAAEIASMNLRDLLKYYTDILDLVKKSPKAVEEVEKAINKVNDEIVKTDQKTLNDSLVRGLKDVKDEYELALDLDATPELADIFAEMMGISKEQLDELPRDFNSVVSKLQGIVDEKLGSGVFDVRSNLNKKTFEKWVNENQLQLDSDKVKQLESILDYARKIQQDETKKQIGEWNKLLEKYAEYEYKRTQIIKEAEREREAAREKGAPSHVMTAIDMKEAKDLAKVNIEEFQQSSEWITATGDLVGLTDEALGLLIRRIEEFKKSQKYLDAKQIKQLNNALKQLYQQQRKGNPFLQLSNAIRENKMRREEWSKELEEDNKIIEEQNKKIDEGTHLTEEETKTRLKLIDRIKELKEGLATLKDVTPEQVVDYLQTINSVASQAAGAVSDMMKAFGNTEDAETINKVMSTIEKGLQFAQMGAAIGGGWGAAIGGVVGLLVGGLTSFADEISGNADITKEIQKSERAVKRLSNAYEELSWNAEKAYGAIVSGLEQATVENKKLQLAEMERQLELEKSRSKKRYDEERVIELQGQVESLRREIKDATSDIVNELLGISSGGDEITNLVQVMIDAFRNGEDAMEAFGKEWDKMIDNMILKLLVSEYMKRSWDNIMKTIEGKQQEFLEKGNANKAAAEAEIERLKTANAYDLAKEYVMQHYKETGDMYGLSKYLLVTNNYNRDDLARAAGFANAEALRQYLIQQQQGIIAGADAQLERASQDYTEWTLDYMMNEGRDIMMSAAEGLKKGIDEYYDFGELAEEQKLSNLQQGIQGITEDTAGALEAYMNGVSQQVYLHSDLLTQIRDTIVGWEMDVQTGVQAEILLELQNSYQVQMAIQNILQGTLNPTNRAFMVELAS